MCLCKGKCEHGVFYPEVCSAPLGAFVYYRTIHLHSIYTQRQTLHGHHARHCGSNTHTRDKISILFHTHKHFNDILFRSFTPTSLFTASPPSAPLPLLDLLFSLVRVCLMPLSMLIAHCSKAAFIKMIKHSQTTAEYLKASGRGT